MADIKFKVCGNEPPFVAEVWRVVSANCFSFVCYKAIEYSGTCVTLSSLLPSSSYCVKLTDAIGNITGCTYPLTPAQPVSDIPVMKTIMLVGEGYMPSTKSCAYRNTCLCVSPDLVPGESYVVKMNLYTCNINNTTNSISFICTPIGGPSTTIFTGVNQTDPYICCVTHLNKTICYGDQITWNMSTSLLPSASQGNGCARIEITGATPNVGTFCFYPLVQSTCCKQSCLNYVTPTKTVAPPTGPAILCFKTLTNTMDPLDGDSGGIEWTRSSCLALDGYLSDAETFDVTISFIANTDTQNTLRAVYSCAYYYQGATKTIKATALSSSGTHIVSQNGSLILNNITKSALSNYVFWSKSYVTVGSDLTHYFATKGCVCIHAVSGSEDVARTTSTTKRTNETSYVSGVAPTDGGDLLPSII